MSVESEFLRINRLGIDLKLETDTDVKFEGINFFVYFLDHCTSHFYDAFTPTVMSRFLALRLVYGNPSQRELANV
eukprot:3624378-Amphidinium_carterae.1